MMFYSKKLNKKGTLGFTLVEVLVSVGIFSIVMLVATGSVFTIVAANKKTHTLKSVMTNLNFALESMAREIRVGTGYQCGLSGGDCTLGDTSFRFTSNRDFDGDGLNDTLEYSFAVDANSKGRLYQRRYGTDPSPVPITASEINITSMKFYVIGSSASDGKQPKLLITITGSVGEGDSKSTFKIQTTVSQRSIDA